jgi:hypothetical protein
MLNDELTEPQNHFKPRSVLPRVTRQSGQARAVREYELADECSLTLQDAVQSFGFRSLDPLESDLLSLAAGVWNVDRRAIRRHTRWERQLKMICPVNCPAEWNNSQLQQAIVRCLNALTYDSWLIEFSPVSPDAQQPTYSPQLNLSDPSVLVPYSDGLDSLATYEMVRAQRAESPIALTVKTASHIRNRIIERKQRAPDPWAFVELVLGVGNHAEASCRSRSFLFLAVAIVLARLCGVSRILIPETGQGAIGAALTSFGEPTVWGSHPYFTDLFSRLMNLIPWSGGVPRIEHPNLWKTKANLLAEMVSISPNRNMLDDLVRSSRSCTNSRRLKGVRAHRQCGICSNCLLRRISMFHGSFSHIQRTESFVWQDLNAPHLQGSLALDLQGFQITDRHEQIARSAVFAHRDLARLADCPQHPRLREQVRLIAVAQGLSIEDTTCNLRHLLKSHKSEWEQFLSAEIGPHSWLRPLCR